MDPQNVLFAFGLTLFAGLATGIGGVLAYFTRRTNRKFLSTALGFSAGVMIYVSFVEIFTKAEETLIPFFGDTGATAVTVAAFFGGMLLIGIIDKLVPTVDNPHEPRSVEEMRVDDSPVKDVRLLRMGIFTALAITIHNFPEGLATFAAALSDPSLGISIAFAIAIHNVPEGVAVAVPVYYATGNRGRALLYSFLSGFAEPAGALVGYFLLLRFMNEATFGVVFAMVAGIMVFISLDELLPTAHKYGEHHLAIGGLIGGMLVMAASLLLFM